MGAWFQHAFDLSEFEPTDGEASTHYLVGPRELPIDWKNAESDWAWTNQPTVLISDMHRGYVVSDGWDEYHFTRGSNNHGKPRWATFAIVNIQRLVG
ncbi:MAG: hypothetical protein ACJZ59_05560 [Candidatus Thalassarchaeaceae archaeon]